MTHPISAAERHDHHHHHGHDDHHAEHGDHLAPRHSLLQVSALWRLAGAVALLVPLWFAVYRLVA